jgi:ABC-type nitrate/sulfonate/bicarbonate transport system permease component
MRFVGTLLQAIIGLVVIALAWWIAASMGPQSGSQMLPGPEAVASKAIELLQLGAFQQHIWASLTVLLYGLAPALLAGMLLGAAAGASSGARWVFGPLILVIAAAPLVVLLPMLILWFGLTIAPKVILVFLVAAFSAANTTMTLWPKRTELPLRRGEEASAPGAARAVMAGLRLGVILGVSVLMVAELAASNTGLGYFVLVSGQMFNTTDALAAALVIILPTVAVGAFLQAIEEQLA